MTIDLLDHPIADDPTMEIGRVVAALKSVRIAQTGLQEIEIHDALSAALREHAIAHRREYTFGPRCRADIWVQGIVVEVKKQRPARQALIDQIDRYAANLSVRAIIIVLERSIALPAALHGKPVASVSLNALWGIAL